MASRQERIIVRLNPDMKERFQEIAGQYGITMSALGAYVIGQWVVNQEGIRTQIPEKIKEVMLATIGEEMGVIPDFVDKYVDGVLCEMLKEELNKKAVNEVCLDTGVPLE